ncbi:hypothetical protein YPPY19_0432, partial [Yersinia pestis PY-19]
MDPGL